MEHNNKCGESVVVCTLQAVPSILRGACCSGGVEGGGVLRDR